VKRLTARALRAAAVVLLGMAVAGAPVLTYAQHGFGGGGGHAGGGHFGGGGHFAGGHVSAGHYAGGAHAFAAPHYAASAHYGGFAGHGYAAPHYGAASHFAAAGVGHYGIGAGHAGWTGRYGAGYYGGRYWGGAHYWGGGYWHGVFWPHIWFNPGWAWWLGALPLGYATFWWGGVPYYYWNDLYYTWSPGYNGYVVTEPPPVATDDNSAQNSGDAGGAQYAQPGEPAPYNGPAQSGAGVGDVYVYPRNGQSDAQTQSDRYECHSWAVNQTGFDPTRPPQQASGSADDYRRAMVACLDARGYTAR
jgi:hypothetical protein